MPVPARVPSQILAALSGGKRLSRKQLAKVTGASLMRVTYHTAAMSMGGDSPLEVASGPREDPRGPLPLVFFLRVPPADAPAEVS